MRLVLLTLLCFGLQLPGSPLLAHALPETRLDIAVNADGLALTLAMPLHELDLALSDQGGLGAGPAPGPLSRGATDRLSDYLHRHLALEDAAGQEIDLRLVTARVELAMDDHVGKYHLLVIDLAAQPGGFPMTLRNDLIMHEVRSHRAVVYLAASGSAPLAIGVIRIDPASGTAPAMTIPAAP